MLPAGGHSSKGNEEKEPVGDNTEKTTLKVAVQDEINRKGLFGEDISVEGKVETLADSLEKTKGLGVKMEDSQYGKTTMAMKGVETGGSNKRPWWLYGSENNESYKATGSCDATSNPKIKDGDDFIFTHTASYQSTTALS